MKNEHTRAEMDALDAEADAAQANANAWLDRRKMLERLRRSTPTDAMPDIEHPIIARLRTLGTINDAYGTIGNDAISHILHADRVLSYTYPLAIKFCRMVLNTESVAHDGEWRYWHASETSSDNADILHWMVVHGHIELHESEPMVWRYTEATA